MELVKSAQTFMLSYLSDREEKTPSDFDRDILGISFDTSILSNGSPMWNNTIFCTALGNLVSTGMVMVRQDEEDRYYYRLSKALCDEQE